MNAHSLNELSRQRASAAFVFDMDGTLIDNMGAHHAAWAHFLERYGIRLDLDELRHRMHGKTNREILLDIVSAQLNDNEIEQLAFEKERLYREEFSALVKPVPGLDEFLGRVRSSGLSMAVATSANAPNIKFVFDLLELHAEFDVVVGAEQISRGKPDPEVFLRAAEQLGVAPSMCIAFEDSLPGIESAHRAGMPVVALATGHDAQHLRSVPGVVEVTRDYVHLDPLTLTAHLPAFNVARAG